MERGTVRGTEVRCGPRARLDWTHPKILAKHTYLFTKVACIACFRVFHESIEVKGHVHI